jgi:hypothetical protein
VLFHSNSIISAFAVLVHSGPFPTVRRVEAANPDLANRFIPDTQQEEAFRASH